VREVAAFDFDGTLSTRDNVLPFLVAAVGPARTAGALGRIAPRLAAAALASERRDDAKAALVRRTLTGYERKKLDRIAYVFANDVFRHHLRHEMVDRVAWHRDRGHEVVLVSASFGDYLAPIADRLGIDGVLATELEVGPDGRLTGRLAGPNVRGREKVRRFERWLGDEPARLWAYGDSGGDRELLARADHGTLLAGRRRRGRR
jgi:phosphatidylglycerophosphatase C